MKAPDDGRYLVVGTWPNGDTTNGPSWHAVEVRPGYWFQQRGYNDIVEAQEWANELQSDTQLAHIRFEVIDTIPGG